MHPLRIALHNELHSRPSIYFSEPANVHHLAFVDGDDTCSVLIEQLEALADSLLPRNNAQGLLHIGQATLKWERHGEFFTLTLVQPRQPGSPLWGNWPSILEPLLAPHRERLISATQLLVEATESWMSDPEHCGFIDPAASHLAGGGATVWSDFRLDECGVNRLLLINHRLNAYRLGRLVRRLLEIETYRMMASLTLPVAQQVSQELKDYDRELEQLSERNASGTDSARTLSAELARLSARIVRTTARTRQRFSAATAYAQLVDERIDALRESHVEDCQRLGVFIERRFRPTVRYCEATDQRLTRLAQSVGHLSDLLQVRVQGEVEEQNSAILRSLNARADTQIKIQKAVEGLSIIAISYYLLSLFKLFYQGLHGIGLELSVRTGILTLGPLAVLTLSWVMLNIHRARRH